MNLPIFSVKQAFLDAVSGGSAVVTAPTGSGKSTQIPWMLLEAIPAGQRVLVLQPRRLAARMLAERVAAEHASTLGKVVGFQTRYERAVSPDSRIVFITEGILTRMLVSEPELPGVAAVVFDEFHERSINTDLGLAMARYVRENLRPDLKIVVMSATMQAAPVRQFLGNCPEVHAEGRLFGIDISYCTAAEKLLGAPAAAARALASLLATGAPGDVLIFMPGGAEIRHTIEACQRLRGAEDIDFLPLYGDLPPDLQRMCMAPSAHRKVIVATNIAETSLTIPGVRHVIDSGLARVNVFSPARGVDSLVTIPIARDSAEQRTGRAGREAPGTCRRLWTMLEQSAKPARTPPEVSRVDLAEAVLAVNAFGFKNPDEFPWFEKPPERTLAGACELLERLGFTVPQRGGLTPLGRRLHAFPAHPRLSLLMWNGAQAGCFQMCAWVAAIISERPLTTPEYVPTPYPHGDLPASDFIARISLAQAASNVHFNPLHCRNMGVNPASAREICRAAANFIALGQRARWTQAPSKAPQADCLKAILRSFPDRLARRRDFTSLSCEVTGGKRAELARDSVATTEHFFVTAEIREAKADKAGTRLTLSLASGIREEWLLECFPDEWHEVDTPFWDEKRQQVLRRQSTFCLGLKINEKIRPDPDPEQAAQILAELVITGKLPLPAWNEDVEKWLARVRWTASIFPKEKLPVYDDDDRADIIRKLCDGITSARALEKQNVLEAVQNHLTWQQRQFVEKMAPPFLLLPNGHRMKISYAPGQTPKGRSRIQDFYDVTISPTVADGRIPVLLDILAPNQRTVQITDDLSNFWRELYPKIKPALARRYPRHLWK